MKLQLLLFSVLVCLTRVPAQSDFWQNPLGPQGVQATGIYYSPNGDLYATYGLKPRVLRSLDKGFSWQPLTIPASLQALNFKFKTGFNGMLFVWRPYNNQSTVFYSRNQGDSWTELPSLPYFTDITEATDSALWVSTKLAVLKSYDAIHWDTIYSIDPQAFAAGFYRVDWLTDSTMVIGSSGPFCNSPHACLLFTKNLGGAWSTMPSYEFGERIVPWVGGTYLTDYPSFNCMTITGPELQYEQSVCPENPNFDQQGWLALNEEPNGVLLSYNLDSTYISHDGGQTWLPHPYAISGLLSHEILPDHQLLATSGNLIRSGDLGQTWKFSGFGQDQADTYSWVKKGQDKLFACSKAGFWRSLDGGENWQIVPNDTLLNIHGFKYRNAALGNDGAIYKLLPNLLHRSTDDGTTFSDISPGLVLGEYQGLAVHPVSGDLYVNCTYGLFKSYDQGQNWQIINQSTLFDAQPIVFHPDGAMFAVCKNAANTYGTIAMSSADGGISWQPVTFPNLAFQPSISILKMTPQGRVIAGYYSAFMLSDEQAENWQQITPVDANYNLTEIITNAAGQIFVANFSNSSIERFEPDGSNSTKLPAIPTAVPSGVRHIAFDAQERLWVNTMWEGHYRSANPVSMLKNQDFSSLGMLAYPNPASTGFSVQIPDNLPDAALTISDMYGRQVLEKNLNPGLQYLPRGSMVDGIYILAIRVQGQLVYSGKIILK